MDIAAPAPDGASGDPVTSDAPAGEPEQWHLLNNQVTNQE
jgi:hypothetical protein